MVVPFSTPGIWRGGGAQVSVGPLDAHPTGLFIPS